jgi:hypothetical protein
VRSPAAQPTATTRRQARPQRISARLPDVRAFSFTADLVLITLGGKFKLKEKL